MGDKYALFPLWTMSVVGCPLLAGCVPVPHTEWHPSRSVWFFLEVVTVLQRHLVAK